MPLDPLKANAIQGVDPKAWPWRLSRQSAFAMPVCDTCHSCRFAAAGNGAFELARGRPVKGIIRV